MNECLLCKKDMSKSKDVFGNGCIKNIYSFLNLTMPRKLKNKEEYLYNEIMKREEVSKLSKTRQNFAYR